MPGISKFALGVMAIAAAMPLSLAHFTLQTPVPSREKQSLSSSVRFWPIGGGDVLRDRKDCLEYPRGQVASLQAGARVPLSFEIGDGAAHIGPCYGYLINLDSGQSKYIGEQHNCVSNGQAYYANLPNEPCARCVVKVKVTAIHLGPELPEFYDSCVDVSISVGHRNSGGFDQPKVLPKVPKHPRKPRKARHRSQRDHVLGNGKSQSPRSPATPSPIPPTNDRDPGSEACGYEYRLTCSSDGHYLMHCLQSQWVKIRMAPGTRCTTKRLGYPIVERAW